MRLAWVAILLTGCEAMESADSPFRPVKAEISSSAAETVDSEPFWDDGETLLISSEDMAIGALPVDTSETVPLVSTESAAAEPAGAVDPSGPAPGLSVVAVAGAPLDVGVPAVAASVNIAAPAASGWPVRLVRTLPDTQPPRAILGLPDGTEIVVSPGSMVPAHGLVVVAIGRQSAQLARVTALGDHASVDSVTLTSMY
jgi:hypothetical protein